MKLLDMAFIFFLGFIAGMFFTVLVGESCAGELCDQAYEEYLEYEKWGSIRFYL